MNYLKMLVDEFHSTVVATLDQHGYPQTRAIDMMLYDEKGIYFLTAKGKAFYQQLISQQYISLTALKDKRAISLKGKVKCIHHTYLKEIFQKNTYMQKIYPENTRDILEVFCLYEATGEYFDITDPSSIIKETFTIGSIKKETGYFINDTCIGCLKCLDVCPQKCIHVDQKVKIDQRHCLSCGRCLEICPVRAIEREI